MLSRVVQAALIQRLMTLLAAGLLVAAGVWAYRELPVDAFPDISTTQVQVIVKAPGMGPLEVEQRITHRLETEVRGIPNQTVLRSQTKYGLSLVTIDFSEGTDIYWARQQVNERIGGLLAELPEGVEGGLAPITMPLSDVYMFLVEGDGMSPRELRAILDWQIRPRLLGVDGVADVNCLGGEVRAYLVTPRPRDLESYGLTLEDVERALQENNRNAGGDRYNKGDEIVIVRTEGQIASLEALADITVTTRDGVPIHLHDLADVGEGALVRYGGVTRNGQGEGVQGLVLNRRGANGRKTVEGVKAALEALAPSLPEGVRLVPFYDRSDLVVAALRTVEKALLEAVALVLLVLVVFLGNLRAALTVGTVLPLTVLGAFVPMRYLGMSANLMSLGGLAIAIGILVDAAVVMVENVHSQLNLLERPGNRLHVTFRAAAEVAAPILSGMVIIVASLLPIASLQGVEGKLFAPLAITICFALLTSLALSLTVIPTLASLLMRGSQHGEGRLQRGLLAAYRPAVRWALRHRPWAVVIALVLLVAAGAVFPFLGREFLPYLDEGTIVIQTEKAPTISLERSQEIDTDIQKRLMQLPEIAGMVSRVGADELRLDPMGLNETDNFMITRPRAEWQAASTQELLDKMRVVLESFPGVSFGFTQPIDMRVSEMLTGVRSAVAIKLQGDDLQVLEEKGRRIEELVAAVPGAVDLFRSPLTGMNYLTIGMRWEDMSRLGVSAEDVNRLVDTAVGGRVATEVLQGVRRVPVLLRYPEEVRSSKDAIGELRVEAAGGQLVRLVDVAALEEQDGPVQIKREDGRRQVVVQANVQGRDVVGFAEDIRRTLDANLGLEPGYEISYGGQFENQQRASRHLGLVIPITVALVFMLLFLTFRSMRQALLLLMNIPFALVGGVFALLLTGLYLSVPASLGFIALLGIAIQNGVVMLTYFNQLREKGQPLEEAVRLGAERRLRPVLMTSLLTILGLVPLLIADGPGAEIQRPLAVVVVGGVLTATLLTLLLLPTLYAWSERGSERRSRRQAPARDGSTGPAREATI